MSKVTIEYTLPEEQNEYHINSHALDFACSLWNIDQKLRNWIKYGHNFKSADEALEETREILREVMDEYGVNLDMIE